MRRGSSRGPAGTHPTHDPSWWLLTLADVEWTKRLAAHAGAGGGWRDDFPLDDRLPELLTINAGNLRLPIHPLYAVRLQTFIAWHEDRGRSIALLPPDDVATGQLLSLLGFGDRSGAATVSSDRGDVALPVTNLRDQQVVEEVANHIRELLEYEMTDVAPLGAAAFMAVSELCGNAVEHGRNPLGAHVCSLRAREPRRLVSIAISDLGIGIPEHLRSRYPEWVDDTFAVARAMDEGVTGTGDDHRGNGFGEVFREALSSTLHAARIQIHSASGFVRRELVQERDRTEPLPAPAFRRGTCITYDLVSAES